jgi:hypothetical protein
MSFNAENLRLSLYPLNYFILFLLIFIIPLSNYIQNKKETKKAIQNKV